MANVGDFLTWATNGADLKRYLRVASSSDDFILELIFETVVEVADAYLSAREDYVTLPRTVELAVYQAVAVWHMGRDADGLKSATTKDLTEEYSQALVSDQAFASFRAMLRMQDSGEGRLLDGK